MCATFRAESIPGQSQAVDRLGEGPTGYYRGLDGFTVPVLVIFPVVMPWLPRRVMLPDTLRMLVEAPVTVAPIMMVVPGAIFEPPLAMMFCPFGMMLPEPSRMVIVPPVGVVPSRPVRNWTRRPSTS